MDGWMDGWIFNQSSKVIVELTDPVLVVLCETRSIDLIVFTFIEMNAT